MAILDQKRLKQYLGLNYNVLFRGPHGVGKTSVITKVFDDAGLKWKYFSASTLDPWVDFVGVPKVIEGPTGSTLELIRPGYIQADDIQALFFDEFNRAPDKVINAVMELIQFKSINGFKLKNLKVIWAAINPEDDDDTYSVNHLDPAHIDRFHVQLDVPFKIDEPWFKDKFPRTGQTFIDWWNSKDMPDEVRATVSPRRLEYAAHAHENSCRLEDFLPRKSGIKKLRDMLTSINYHEAIGKITNETEAKAFLTDINNSTKVLEMSKNGDTISVEFFKKYRNHLPKELVEAVAEFLVANRHGTTFKTITEFIESLNPGEKGDQGTAAIINNLSLDAIMNSSGAALVDELKALNTNSKHILSRLVSKMIDVLTTVSVKVQKGSPPNTLAVMERVLWGPKGKNHNQPTNFAVICKLLTKIDPTLFASSRASINRRLYDSKIVSELHWI